MEVFTGCEGVVEDRSEDGDDKRGKYGRGYEAELAYAENIM